MDAQYSLKHLKHTLEFEIQDASALVGRSSNCEIQVDRETLSREHARILLRGDKISVQDLHSTNGTFVNERQIHEVTPLAPGDVVRFGQESFCLQNDSAEATVMFDKSSFSKADSAMLVEDEEEEDATVMLQSIVLPAGWEKSADIELPDAPVSEGDAALLKALKKHAKLKRRHRFALLVTLTQNNKPPAVKLLSSDKEDASWVVGRNAQADIPLSDPRISEQHGRICLLKGKWQFLDTNSKNGSYQGDKPIKALPLLNTQQVDIEPFHLILEALEDQDA